MPEQAESHTFDQEDTEPDLSKAVGKDLADLEEHNQEMLDSLVADGFPKNEQKRREEWMKLPRNCRIEGDSTTFLVTNRNQ